MHENLKQSLTYFKKSFDRKIDAYFDSKIGGYDKPELKVAISIVRDYVLAGGKRLRPYILHRMNEEFRKAESIDDVLLGFEFLHNSTLIDDDIIDEHHMRRDKPTIASVYDVKKYRGGSVALLSANLLRGMGIDLIADAELPEYFQKGCIAAYRGIGRNIDTAQLLDLEYRQRLDISEDEYIDKVDLVTATFIAHMFQLCAPLSHAAEFYEVGRDIGRAFQLSDDLMDIDVTKHKGRYIGSDIREGSQNLLSVYASGRLNKTDRNRFEKLFGKKNIAEDDLHWIIQQYDRVGAIKDIRGKIREYNDRAKQILIEIGLPEDHWISEFGEYSLKRSH